MEAAAWLPSQVMNCLAMILGKIKLLYVCTMSIVALFATSKAIKTQKSLFPTFSDREHAFSFVPNIAYIGCELLCRSKEMRGKLLASNLFHAALIELRKAALF